MKATFLAAESLQEIEEMTKDISELKNETLEYEVLQYLSIMLLKRQKGETEIMSYTTIPIQEVYFHTDV